MALQVVSFHLVDHVFFKQWLVILAMSEALPVQVRCVQVTCLNLDSPEELEKSVVLLDWAALEQSLLHCTSLQSLQIMMAARIPFNDGTPVQVWAQKHVRDSILAQLSRSFRKKVQFM